MSQINYGTFANPIVKLELVVEDGEQLVKINFSKTVKRPLGLALDVTISYFFETQAPNKFVRLERIIPLPGAEGRRYPEFACEAMISRDLEIDLMEQCPSRLGPYLESVKDALYGLGRRIYQANKAQRPERAVLPPLASGKTRGRPRKNQDAQETKVEASTSAPQSEGQA